MDTGRWRQIEDLFERARRLDAVAREALLSDPGDVPAEVVESVRRLLAADVDAEAGDFLSAPATPLSVREWTPAQRVGSLVDAYRLLWVIGSGGMGTVFLAERADGVYEQRVAVKLIKRGMDTEEMLRRFRIERQVLARLEHPGIERLLDGGATEDGLPYLVTEYIEGRPIDAYCDERRLTIEARLQLFCKVCEAVDYAHRMLVVHRDLKPSNILVTAEGDPKLLDFGIAKMLSPEAGEFGETTRAERPLTPEYASPEQVRGVPVTTASDLYSLGVVLYRLLTGRAPYRLTAATPLEIERVVCGVEPTRPSAAVTRVETFETTAGIRTITPEAVSRDRGSRPERLARRLRGDLDTIVSTALRKSPERRYPSAAKLSEDVQRHLRGLPLTARRPTLRYRVVKFARRNRSATVAASLIAVSLLIGLAGVVRESRRARSEAETSRQVLDYVDEVLRQVPGRGMSRPSAVGELLTRGVARVETQLADQPAAQARVLETIAGVYESYEMMREAVDIRFKIVELRGTSRGDPRLAGARNDLARVLLECGRVDEAMRILSEADDRSAETLHLRALAHWGQGDAAQAEALFEQALESPPADSLQRTGQLVDVGRFRLATGEHAEAERTLRRAIERLSTAGNERTILGVRARLHLGRALYERERVAEADQTLRLTLRAARDTVGYDHPLVAEVLRELSVVRRFHEKQLGMVHRHDLIARQAVTLHARLLGERHREVARSQLSFASTARDPVEREMLARRALATMRAVLPEGHVELADPLVILGRRLALDDRSSEAEPLLREALDIRRRRLPARDWRNAEALEALGLALLAQHRLSEAEALLHEALALLDAPGLSIRRVAENVLRGLVALYVASGDTASVERYGQRLDARRLPVPVAAGDVLSGEPASIGLDYDDDCVEKTIHVGAENLTRARGATLWIFGKPYNYAGGRFVDREDSLIRVNGDTGRERTFDVRLAFHGSTEAFTWALFDLPLGWLTAGDNQFFVSERSPEGSWDHNNLMIGVDARFDDASARICINDRPCCYLEDGATATESKGLMMFLELEGVPHEAAPAVDAELALLLAQLGESLLERQSPDAARRCFERARTLYRALDDGYGIAVADSGIGACLVASRRFGDAERRLLHSYAQLQRAAVPERRRVLERLIAVYEGLDRSDRVARYRRILNRLPLPLPQQQPDPHKPAAGD